MTSFYSAAMILLFSCAAPIIRNELLFLSGPWVKQESELTALQISGKLVGQRYCRGGDNEHATLFLEVAVTARNKGYEAVVLSTDSHLLTEVVIARDESDLKLGKIVGVVPLHPSVEKGARLEIDDFARLAPGQELRLARTLNVPILFARRGFSLPNMPGPGSYVAQMKVSLWGRSRRMTQEWRERLRSLGTLWTDPVDAAPLTFSIDSSALIYDCNLSK